MSSVPSGAKAIPSGCRCAFSASPPVRREGHPRAVEGPLSRAGETGVIHPDPRRGIDRLAVERPAEDDDLVPVLVLVRDLAEHEEGTISRVGGQALQLADLPQ